MICAAVAYYIMALRIVREYVHVESFSSYHAFVRHIPRFSDEQEPAYGVARRV